MNTLDSADNRIKILEDFSINFYDASMTLKFWLK